ncbi:hypothetical protein [Bradyrhizobium zhanjiangense]|nr:hypothetical protein [Bradyrhizobium zhanjiangense]
MKRPTKAKRKAKTVKRKPASRKSVEKVTPIHLQPGVSIRMSLHDLIRAVQMIEKHGHLKKFTSKLKREQAQVRVPADTVNLVKNFVADNGLHTNAIGKHIVHGRGRAAAAANEIAGAAINADDGDPNKCHFGRAERG